MDALYWGEYLQVGYGIGRQAPLALEGRASCKGKLYRCGAEGRAILHLRIENGAGAGEQANQHRRLQLRSSSASLHCCY